MSTALEKSWKKFRTYFSDSFSWWVDRDEPPFSLVRYKTKHGIRDDKRSKNFDALLNREGKSVDRDFLFKKPGIDFDAALMRLDTRIENIQDWKDINYDDALGLLVWQFKKQQRDLKIENLKRLAVTKAVKRYGKEKLASLTPEMRKKAYVREYKILTGKANAPIQKPAEKKPLPKKQEIVSEHLQEQRYEELKAKYIHEFAHSAMQGKHFDRGFAAMRLDNRSTKISAQKGVSKLEALQELIDDGIRLD